MSRAAIILAVILALTAAPTAAEIPDEQTREAIRKAVKQKLNDPESARFRWLPRGEGDIYCGFVNARNSFGGYAGFTPFMVLLMNGSRGTVAAAMDVPSSDPSSSSQRALAAQCVKEGVNLTAPTEDDPAPNAAAAN